MENDPVTARLLRHRTGLEKGGVTSEHEVLATYRTKAGGAPFAFCRRGLLFDPEGEPRYLPFSEIADAGYHNIEMIKRAKAVKASGNQASDPLSIKLVSGEVIDLPIDVRDDGMPDLLNIAKLIDMRVTVSRSDGRKRTRD